MNCVQCQAALVPGALWCGGCGMPVMAVPWSTGSVGRGGVSAVWCGGA
jgi:hypothetical protein